MKKVIASVVSFILILSLTLCISAEEQRREGSDGITYTYAEHPLERNGIALHLDCMKVGDNAMERNILLIHGVTYSSHEFDVVYEDYRLFITMFPSDVLVGDFGETVPEDGTYTHTFGGTVPFVYTMQHTSTVYR